MVNAHPPLEASSDSWPFIAGKIVTGAGPQNSEDLLYRLRRVLCLGTELVAIDSRIPQKLNELLRHLVRLKDEVN